MIRATDIHSLTEFQKNAKSYIRQIKKTGQPMAITVNGEAELVIQDATSYQKMVDELDRANLIAAILEGEADIAAGKVRPAHEVFAEWNAHLATRD